MVPGIAEREIRQHANQRQEWLQSESTLSMSSLSGDRSGTRAVLASALARAQQAIASLVRREAAREGHVEHVQPVRLETARR